MISNMKNFRYGLQENWFSILVEYDYCEFTENDQKFCQKVNKTLDSGKYFSANVFIFSLPIELLHSLQIGLKLLTIASPLAST